MELQLDPKQINEFISQRIIESSLGAAMKKSIEEKVASWQSSYDNPAKSVVESFVRDQCRELLQTEFKEKICTQIRAMITEERINEIATEAVSNLKLNGSRY